jgi:thioesterase domain-containing protein
VSTTDTTVPAGVLTYRARGDRPPIILLPAVNGLGWVWSALVRHLPAGHPVHALQDVRLGSTDVPDRTVRELATDYAATIRDLCGDGPCVLVGWSFGGTVAHQVAAELSAEGRPPALLVLLDSFHGPGGADPDDVLPAALDGLVPTPGAPLTGSALRQALSAHGSPLATLDEAVLTALVRVAAANSRAQTAHVPDTVGAPVLFVNAKADGDAHASDLWRPHAITELDVHTVSAGHLELLQAPTSHEIGALIHRKVLATGSRTADSVVTMTGF